MKIKSWLQSANQFLKQYGLVLLVLIGGGYWLLDTQNGMEYGMNELVRSQSVSRESMVMYDAMPSTAMDYEYDDYAYEAEESMFSKARSIAGDAILPPDTNAQGFDPESLNDRKIIKNGSLQLEVEDTDEALALVNAELQAQGAFTTHQNSWEVRRGVLAYNVTIRVPADKLETLSQNLETLGVKKSENYSTNDITAQYRDTANRIKNLEVRRDRLRELMTRETENIGDILEIDRELTNVQNQLDSFNSTQKQRDTDVAYSTLQLTLNPEPEIGDFSSPDWNLEYSWKSAVNDFFYDAREIVDKLIRVVVYTPIWLPILLIVWGLKRWWFSGKKKSKK